jgi:gas vesicle structural protein
VAIAQATPRGYLERPRPSGLADVIDVILDKGLVIDAYVRVSLIGIEILTIDARIVIASVDTYLRFAEAVGRLDLRDDESQGLPELMESVTSGGAKSKTQGALEGVKESLFGGDDEEEEEEKEKESSRSRSRSRASSGGSSRRSSSSRSGSSKSSGSRSRSRKGSS